MPWRVPCVFSLNGVIHTASRIRTSAAAFLRMVKSKSCYLDRISIQLEEAATPPCIDPWTIARAGPNLHHAHDTKHLEHIYGIAPSTAGVVR